MSEYYLTYDGLGKYDEEIKSYIDNNASSSSSDVDSERLIDNASKNILENKLESGSAGSGTATISYTVTEDGEVTITANTATGTQYLTINDNVKLYAGNYTLYGCCKGGQVNNNNNYWLELTYGTTTIKDYGHGAQFTVASDVTATVRIAIAISTTNLTFKPEIERGTQNLLSFTDPSGELEYDENIIIIDEYEVDGDIYIITYNQSTGEVYPPQIKPSANPLSDLSAENNFDPYYPTNVELAEMIGDMGNVDIATTTTVGTVKPDGTSITIDQDGTIHGADTVPIATTSVAGKVKPDGTTIEVDANGGINAKTATTSNLGIVQPDGTTIEINSGTISAKTATTSTKGVMQPDNVTVTVNGSGVLSGKKATTSNLGVVKPDGTTLVTDSNGVMSFNYTNYTTTELDEMWADALEAAEDNNTAELGD